MTAVQTLALPGDPAPAPAATRAKETTEQQAARCFPEDIKGHTMTVLRDDGLYRHLRFRQPGTICMGFDIVTWPGHLAVTGDMGDLMFSRLPDMVEFFGPDNRINPMYWAQKLTCGRGDVKAYDEDALREHVNQDVDMWIEDADLTQSAAKRLREAVKDEVLIIADEGEHRVRAALDDFRHREGGREFEFVDTWEWDLTEYTYHFLWLCHAITWGIGRYIEAGGKVVLTERQWMDGGRVPEDVQVATVEVVGGVL